MKKTGDLVGHIIFFHKTGVTKVWMFSFWIVSVPYAKTDISRAQQIVFNWNLQKKKKKKKKKNFSVVDDILRYWRM
jgi:hypothetical protein